jgi:hypothetical protein
MATQETIRDIGNQMAKWDRERQQANLNADMSQSAAFNPDNKTPFQDHNQFLAEEVRKIGEASAERARLNSEQAKEEYDNQVRANILKQKELAETQQQRTDLAAAQNAKQNIKRAQEIFQQLNAINLEPYRGMTQDNIPAAVLGRLVQLGQEWNNLRESVPDMNLPPYDPSFLETGIGIGPIAQEEAIAPVNQEYPATFENGRYSDFKTNENGSVEIRLSSGEIYKAGNVEELLEKISKSKVDTNCWAREQRALAQQQMTTPAQPTASTPEYSSIADMWAQEQAEAFAKQLGFSNKEELMQWGEQYQQDREALEEFRTQNLAYQFQAAHPEFPGTPAASEALADVIEQQGWNFTPDTLSAAHALAVQRGLYQPLTPDQIAVANGTAPAPQSRPPIAPMIRSGNPEGAVSDQNPWTMDLTKLRQMTIRQQLGER